VAFAVAAAVEAIVYAPAPALVPDVPAPAPVEAGKDLIFFYTRQKLKLRGAN
jgi:hypothetical protein